MFRVYDKDKKEWAKDDIYLSPDGELFLVKFPLIGRPKLSKLSQERYVYHDATELFDKEGVQVFEGDYIQCQVEEDKSVIGMVTYVPQMAAYVTLCVDSDEFYTLGIDYKDLIKVVGNVFDGYEVVQDGEQTLRN
jgi:hypothetical protein